MNRRHFMQSIRGAPRCSALLRRRAAAVVGRAKIEAKADTMILLWMAGGMAQTETFDPKKYTAFEKGLACQRVLSTFPAIDTAVDNIKLSQGLESVAKVMDRATLIRSHRLADLGLILHSRHQYHWHTGYMPPQSVAAPHLGAVIARTLGPAQSGSAGIHRHRPESGDRRGKRRAQIVPHGGIPGERVRPVSDHGSGRRVGQRASAGLHSGSAFRRSRTRLTASWWPRAR